MVVIVDTPEFPGVEILKAFYKSPAREITPEELVEGRVQEVPGEKVYYVPDELDRDVLKHIKKHQEIVHIFHKELLSEKEMRYLRSYSKVFMVVTSHGLSVRHGTYESEVAYIISNNPDEKSDRVFQVVSPSDSQKDHRVQGPVPHILSDYQREMKEKSLPYLLAQKHDEICFPSTSSSDDWSDY